MIRPGTVVTGQVSLDSPIAIVKVTFFYTEPLTTRMYVDLRKFALMLETDSEDWRHPLAPDIVGDEWSSVVKCKFPRIPHR